MRNHIARMPRAWKGAGVALASAGLVTAALTYAPQGQALTQDAQPVAASTTPIKHVVVLFDENESFDHYFGTYPNVKYPTGAAADGGDGSPFTKSGTPKTSDGQPINNYASDPSLIDNNPNTVKPFRLSADQAWTCSQGHAYTPEEKAVTGVGTDGTTQDAGNTPMDTFVQNTSHDTCTGGGPGPLNKAGEAMGYYDGNTVTGLWNYAQNYAMSENSWADNFGPSTVGAINVVSGQTHGAVTYDETTNDENPTAFVTGISDGGNISAIDSVTGVGTVIGDPDPVYDDCANIDHTKSGHLGGMQDSNKNIGDLLNTKGDTWGYFAGGFDPTTPWNPTATANDPTVTPYAKCDALSSNIAHTTGYDYNPHHNPFAYYKSTSNPHHFPGTPGKAIGAADPTNDTTMTGANHQYDLSVFYKALEDNQLPAVSYLKAKYAEDAHPANSDPIDEQHFLTRTIDAIMQSPEWSSTAIFIAYDDSDGWYDHVPPTITNGSNTHDDVAVCNTAPTAASPAGGYQDRCGPSQRLPLMLISPYAKRDYVSNVHSSQASIVKFIEDNFSTDKIGDSSFDATAGSLMDMFDFKHPRFGTTLLRADGTIKSTSKSSVKLTAKAAKVAETKTKATDNVTVTAKISGTTYAPTGSVTAKVNGKTVKTVALNANGQVVFSKLALKKPKYKGKKHVLQSNTIVFSFGANADYNAASVTVTVKS